jgi:hypothetical protein
MPDPENLIEPLLLVPSPNDILTQLKVEIRTRV